MRLVPKAYDRKIAFFKYRAQKWAERAGEIGLSPETVAQLQAVAEEAEEAARAERMAWSALKSARQARRSKVKELGRVGAACIKQIRGRAGSSPGVYPLAMIPPPKQHAPIGPPGEPTNFTAELTTLGGLVLKWACAHPRGSVATTYSVWRQIDGGKLEFCAQSGRKRFTDMKLPMGVKSITYKVQATRSTCAGPWGHFTVHFGTSELGEAFTTMMHKEANPLAA
jgi:hypothetical protein